MHRESQVTMRTLQELREQLEMEELVSTIVYISSELG